MNKDSEFNLRDLGFLDGLANKEPSREFIVKKEYREGYSKGFWQYHRPLQKLTNGHRN
ncbi:MAG: hypothetical protein QNJ38_17585 [Prochloraceae cyanobacterium]|nr:hypothetical protein [Prochloraceae cyanobacterium]